MTAHRSFERLLATVPVDERARAAGPPGPVEPPPAPLVTEPLPAPLRPVSPLPWLPTGAAPASTATAPLPLAPITPAAVTRPVVIEVRSPPIRRTPLSSETEGCSPVARAVAPRSRELAVSWLLVASIAAFSGMVAALLTRWWMG
ncbi:hypothetical protein WMF30_03415 [Sorangium sp. So ce134]